MRACPGPSGVVPRWVCAGPGGLRGFQEIVNPAAAESLPFFRMGKINVLRNQQLTHFPRGIGPFDRDSFRVRAFGVEKTTDD